MPRWKTPRWTLAAPALVALAVAGCGAAASQPGLHKTSERRLLSLVQRARVDAAKHDGAAVHAALSEFVSDVKTLTTSGQLGQTTAGRLDRAARATAAQAARQLHPATKLAADTAGTTTQASDPTTTTPVAANSAPAGHKVPPPASVNPPGQDNQGNQSDQGDQGDSGADWPGQGRGHGYGHDGWSDGGQGGSNSTWAQWWSYFTGGAGD